MKKALPILLLFILVAAVSCVNLSEVRVKTRPHHGPSEYVLHSHPSLIVISGTYAYFVSGVEVEIFFHSGHWYRPHNGRWYRGRGYNGPWVHIEKGNLPGVFHNLPPGYRKVPPGHQRIPYGQLKKNWEGWERDRHWDKPRAKPKMEPKAKHKAKGEDKGKRKGKRGDRLKRLWPF